MELVSNPKGAYRFLTGIAPYSSGAVAEPGYEVVFVTLRRLVSYREGFDLALAHLAEAGRPAAALCAMALRCPAPYDFAGFAAFNADYQALLESHRLLVDGRNPVARTNVAPVHAPPSVPGLYGFAYTMPAADERPLHRPTFVVAGGGDLVDQADLRPEAVVRRGETSPDAMAEKAATVMALMRARVDGLGVCVDDVNATNVYCAAPIHALVREQILVGLGEAALHGVRWHLSHPPIRDLAFEMDMRGVRRELWLG